jgi:hypothetical protein
MHPEGILIDDFDITVYLLSITMSNPVLHGDTVFSQFRKRVKRLGNRQLDEVIEVVCINGDRILHFKVQQFTLSGIIVLVAFHS